jgi:hypothetical protein
VLRALLGLAQVHLVSRYGQMGPIRCSKQLSPSFVDAPFGRISIVYVHAQNVAR